MSSQLKVLFHMKESGDTYMRFCSAGSYKVHLQTVLQRVKYARSAQTTCEKTDVSSTQYFGASYAQSNPTASLKYTDYNK